jgi:tetratricopeptide (TPR) repeat protein
MRRALANAAVLLGLAVPWVGAAADAPDLDRLHVDDEAMAEARARGPRAPPAAAVAEYVEGRRLAREGDWRGAAAALRLAVAYDEESAELRAALAEALAQSGQLPQAEEEARRAIALSGDDGRSAAEAHLLLGQLAAARHQLEAAVPELRQAARLEGARARAGERLDRTPWRVLARVELELGDEPAAVRDLEDLAARAPGDGVGYREAGRWLLDRGRPAQAERFLRRAVELSPGDRDAHWLLVRVHGILGRDDDARADLDAILRTDPDDPEALFAQGELAAEAGEVDAAHGWFARHRRACRDPSGAAARVAERWLAAGRADLALASLREAAGDGVEGPRVALAEGEALSRLRRYREAAAALARVPAGEVEYVPARAAQAQALARAGRHQDALRSLADPLRSHPGEARLLLARADVQERAGRWRDAVRGLAAGAAAAERDGAWDDAAALSARAAEVLCRAGRPAEAVALLDRAAADHPRAPALLLGRSDAHRAAGQEGAADADLRALLALAPDQPEALARLAALQAERAGAGSRELDEAEAAARRAVRLAPRFPAAQAALAAALERRGDRAGALAALERAAAVGEPDPDILGRLGDAYRAAGRGAEADRAYHRALDAAADAPPAVRDRLTPTLRRRCRER